MPESPKPPQEKGIPPGFTLRQTLRGHAREVNSVAFSRDGKWLASGADDKTVRVWEWERGRERARLEGHAGGVWSVAFSPDGRLLASRSNNGTVRLWRYDTWDTVAILDEPTPRYWVGGLAFHPRDPVLATLRERDTVIHVWELDVDLLLGAAPAAESVRYTAAKIVLVGEPGVGKTGMGWRLAHDEYKTHDSTHGQQFWLLDSLRARRKDGAECEAVLWDLAGQPDYRLINALSLDDADLALVLFNPTDQQEPLRGVDFWLKSLAHRPGRPCRTILVGARCDVGEIALTPREIEAFCRERGITGGYVRTSAKERQGVDELVDRMQREILWEDMTPTVTPATFKRIKEYVLELKEDPGRTGVLVDWAGLRGRLEALDADWRFTDSEMTAAVGLLATHGFVRRLRTSKGEERVLLVPELVNNLAASFVLEARRNPKGLGALDEQQVRSNGYRFREVEGLSDEEQGILLDAAAVLFIEHNIAFRESHGPTGYLIFPELINLKKPLLGDLQTVDDVSYTVSGAVENVYAALVVLLGYASIFTRTDQWQNQAQYEVGEGEVCGFRQTDEREGEIDLVLYYGEKTSPAHRLLFQGLFESFLSHRNVTVTRYPSLSCPKCGYRQERAGVVRRTRERRGFLRCGECGKKIVIPREAEEILLSCADRRLIEEQHATADMRTRFETALAQALPYLRGHKKTMSCFISYAWGVPEHERWVEKWLARNLQNAGIDVILARWHNAEIGADLPRFISRITECDAIVAIGTPLYLQKYENKLSTTGSVVAAEVDLINQRLIGTEEKKKTVRPVLREGEAETSLPPLMRGKVYGQFQRDEDYFATLFDLILSLYDVSFENKAVADLRESLRGLAGERPRVLPVPVK